MRGWIVIDLDATAITAASKNDRAAVTFKKTWGFRPLAAWCANPAESLFMELRPGHVGAATVENHVRVPAAALEQIPDSSGARILVRVDGAGAYVIAEIAAAVGRCGRYGNRPGSPRGHGTWPSATVRSTGCRSSTGSWPLHSNHDATELAVLRQRGPS
ncbi:transposase [Streptomyces sp. NPDC001553]|uniref:transposase n=1 Tax=Streptomyces sp. NPDC001553 TaxID=3154385 RepID=UPI00331D1C7C